MEQTASRPAHLYIPQPIAQQLDTYDLGELLEVSKRGWVGHDNRKPKFRILIFTLIMLAAAIASVLLVFFVVASTGILNTALLVIPFFTIVAFVTTAVLLFQSSLCLAAFSNGFLYAKGTRVTVLQWNEIASFDLQAVRNMTGKSLVFTIQARDGKIIQVKSHLLPLGRLSQVIRKKIA